MCFLEKFLCGEFFSTPFFYTTSKKMFSKRRIAVLQEKERSLLIRVSLEPILEDRLKLENTRLRISFLEKYELFSEWVDAENWKEYYLQDNLTKIFENDGMLNEAVFCDRMGSIITLLDKIISSKGHLETAELKEKTKHLRALSKAVNKALLDASALLESILEAQIRTLKRKVDTLQRDYVALKTARQYEFVE